MGGKKSVLVSWQGTMSRGHTRNGRGTDAFCEHSPVLIPVGGLWGYRDTAEPQGHRDYWSKAMCQKHPLMDGTGPFASRKGCSSSGWWALATDGQGSNHVFCSPFPSKTQTVYPTPKIREEITVAVGV